MAGWEYQVIHINVEPPKPPAPPQAADGAAPAAPTTGEGSGGKPMFSESFLKKEFPQFYEKPPAEGSAAQAQHPAHQLQTFLNGHGAQGWELVGVFPVGNLTMMFFRRPKPGEPKPVSAPKEAAAALTGESAVMPQPPAAPIHTAGGEGSLQEILRRLDQLEGLLPGREVTGGRSKPADRSVRPGRDGGAARMSSRRAGSRLRAGRQPDTGRSSPRSAPSSERVSPAQLASFADQAPLPSSQAALAIGLRSATSLANHGARYGYAPGLSKRGPNGLVAIYTGPGTAEKGGKERRLWIVVPAQRLEG